MRAFSVTPSGAIKGIPLRSLPKEAWTMLSGGDPDDDDLIALYERVAWLNRGVDLIAEAVAGMPRDFHDLGTGDPTESEPEFTFDLDLGGLLNELTGDLLLHGRAYVMVERNVFGLTKNLRRLSPQSVKPVWDDSRGLTGFKRTVGAKTLDLNFEEVCYVWTPNRRNEVGFGKSKAYAALRAAGFLDNIDTFGGKFFKQGTMRPNIVYVEGQPGDTEVEKLESFFQRMAAGLSNAFKTIAVRSKIESVTFGETPDKLEMPGLTDKKREDVATALGVPQSLLFSNATNFATAQQDDLHFYDKTIKPLAALIFSRLSKAVFEPLGYELRPHPEKLEIYQHLEAEKAEALALMHDRHVITTNEYRDSMSFEQIDGLSEAEEDLIGWSAARAGETLPVASPAGAGEDGQQGGGAVMELRAWRRWLEKRIASGKTLNREFEARHINRTLKAAIHGALSTASTPDERKAVFADAEHFANYP